MPTNTHLLNANFSLEAKWRTDLLRLVGAAKAVALAEPNSTHGWKLETEMSTVLHDLYTRAAALEARVRELEK